jgi:hypothetical protein
MAPFCVPSTSVTNSQNKLPISGEPSLNTLKYYTSFLHFPWRNYFLQTSEEGQSSTENTEQIFNLKNNKSVFITKEANNTEENWNKQRGNKVIGQENRKCKQPQYFGSTRSQNAEKEVNKNRYP